MTETNRFRFSFVSTLTEHLINTNEKDDTSEDDNEEDNKKQRIINSELIPLHARWLEHTAIQRGDRGLVWRWRGLEDYSFSYLLFKDRE